MEEKNKRLYFIDAMRAWAILMMLQGHFIDGLLDPVYRDPSDLYYATWKYFRGITAPVFFTVSGFIFTYLLLRAPSQGPHNPRIRKGLKRGLQLIAIGYLLRINVFGLLNGIIYPSFFLVDVLHCIGVALIVLTGIYVAIPRERTSWFPLALLALGGLLFLFEPVYKTWDLTFMPVALANYFSRANGSVFTIVPWIGYAAIGGFLATLFYRFRNVGNFYLKSTWGFLLVGAGLIWLSSPFFEWLGEQTGIGLLNQVASYNYLFMRLGDVLLVFAAFMLLRGLMKHRFFLEIGQQTLSIYVIHFIVLYGSFTGMGLYRYWEHQLNPWAAIAGAMLFMGLCTWAALAYQQHKAEIAGGLAKVQGWAGGSAVRVPGRSLRWARLMRLRMNRFFSTSQGR